MKINLNVITDLRAPISLWCFLVFIGTLIIQTIDDVQYTPLLAFSGVMIFHIIVHYYVLPIASKLPWTYFIVQGVLILVAASLVPASYPILIAALFPILIAESICLFRLKSAILIIGTTYSILIILYFIFHKALDTLILFSPFIILLNLIFITFANLVLKQYDMRVRTQTFLNELEHVHKKVEHLTIVNERQRMARDLHDTLAQGVAGLIMQLEAVDAHLANGNLNRAKEIVTHAMDRSRHTLAESRMAIDNLRSKADGQFDFTAAIREEAERFQKSTGIKVEVTVNIHAEISKLITEHGLHTIRECLLNIAKHAQASHAWLSISTTEQAIHIEISDDGIGMNSSQIGKEHGHYGLIGIRERTRILGGVINISENSPHGTIVSIEAPLAKGV